jgi:hypothetical protein
MNLGRSCRQETHTEHSSKGLRQLTRVGRTFLTLRRSPARDSNQTITADAVIHANECRLGTHLEASADSLAWVIIIVMPHSILGPSR